MYGFYGLYFTLFKMPRYVYVQWSVSGAIQMYNVSQNKHNERVIEQKEGNKLGSQHFSLITATLRHYLMKYIFSYDGLSD